MPTGLLQVKGTIDIGQFWPNGTSDGDTAKVVLAANAFEFRPHPGSAFAVTHVFDNAKVRGKTTKPVLDAQNRVTVRFQGIDAPELHYMPQALVKVADRTKQQESLFSQVTGNYRQHLGETAAAELGKRLAGIGSDPLPCILSTAIDHPNDAFDTYGRLIADIIVKDAGADLNVNAWMLEEGWAYPTYYNSMTSDEITNLIKIGDAAAKAKRGLWKIAKKQIGTLDWTLKMPKKGVGLDPKDDSPPVIMPKLFRRQVNFAANVKAKMAKGSFEKFLSDHPDACYLTKEFLAEGTTSAPLHRLDEYVKSGTFTVGAGDLVFREASSVLIVPGGGTPTW
jgi:endonuclease YncB( thermonuclease family)